MAEDARVRKTKQKLSAALVALLQEKAFSDITPAQICEKAGINRSTFYRNYKNILQLKTEKKQLEAAQKIAALGLSVRQAELLCKNMSQEAPKKPEIVLEVNYVAECEKSLSKHLGRGVKIVNGKRKGRFELEFYGQEDLQNLLDALMKIQK